MEDAMWTLYNLFGSAVCWPCGTVLKNQCTTVYSVPPPDNLCQQGRRLDDGKTTGTKQEKPEKHGALLQRNVT